MMRGRAHNFILASFDKSFSKIFPQESQRKSSQKKEERADRKRGRVMNNISMDIKKSVHGDEYYSPQNVVDMIVPYVMRGGTERYGVRLIRKKASL